MKKQKADQLLANLQKEVDRKLDNVQSILGEIQEGTLTNNATEKLENANWELEEAIRKRNEARETIKQIGI